MNSLQILVVSDSPFSASALERLIVDQLPRDVRVVIAAAADAAIETTQKENPDVVIVDMSCAMGLAVIERIAHQPDIRVLGILAPENDDLVDNVVIMGVAGVLRRTAPVGAYGKAILRVAEGELWLDRATTGRVFQQMARKSSQDIPPEREKLSQLTRKELVTASEVGRDASAPLKAIAERLHVSENTLRNQLTSIYAKLDLGNRLELYAFVQRNGSLLSEV